MGVADVRASNLATVLRALVRQSAAPSRADLAHDTGLTRATVSRLVDSLLAAGVVNELALASDGSPGRPATPLRLRHGSVVALGLEANVSYVAAVALDLSGEILAQDVQLGDFAGSRPEPVLARLGAMGTGMLDRLVGAQYLGAALALPGLVSDAVLVQAPNLGWHDLEPQPLLDPTGALGPLRLGNEATLAAWSAGRKRPGVPDGPSSFVYISGDVGIGGSIVLDSHPLAGSHGWAGEIGHVCVDPAGPVCSCGARGCLEAYAGHRAMIEAARLPATTTAGGLLAGAQAGSAPARQALDRAAAALGRAIAAAVNVLDVFDVVLGGNLAVLYPALEPGMRAELDEHVLARPAVRVSSAATDLDRLEASRGGALSILDPVMDDPARYLAL
jgi:predicted NBD/HSP70 family sugar kinase